MWSNWHEIKIFNYRLSRARRITENIFGILVARFGIFKTHINPSNAELNPIFHLLVLLGAHPILHVSRIRVNIQFDNIKDVVMASCALHNFLRRTSADMYTPSTCFDTEDLQNGTVTAGLRSTPSSLATLKRGNNRSHQLTGKEVRSQSVE